MSGILAWIKSEPVRVASILGALVTVAVSLGLGQGEAGVIAGALQVILGEVGRSQVTPSSNPKGVDGTPLVPGVPVLPLLTAPLSPSAPLPPVGPASAAAARPPRKPDGTSWN